MKKPIFVSIFYLSVFIILFTAISCGSSDVCKGASNYTVDLQSIEKLHNHALNNNIKTGVNSNTTEVYIDYSDGLHPAIMACNKVFDEVLNLVQNDATRYLVCGRSDSLKPLTRAELDNQYNPKDAKSFIEPISILDKPLERIVAEGNQAIYITDFELTLKETKDVNVAGGSVKSTINLSLDWATKYFDDWLSKGNSIDVFAKPYTQTRKKGVQNQYLYFIIFTPKNLSNNNRLVDGLTKLKSTESDLEHLSFSKSRFQLTTQYDKSEQQGLNENLGLRMHYMGNGFEYYQVKFEDFKRLESVENKLILEKLFFNQQLQGFTNLTFKATVEDVTSAYKLMVDSLFCNQAIDMSKLNLTSNLAPESFQLETKPSPNGNIQFGIKKHESFTALDAKAESQIFKVSILFDSAVYQPDIAKMEKVLQWKDVNLGQMVPGLYGGLKEAASRINLKDTPLYSYYIEVIK
jgi:hypothetical protein